MGEVVSKDEIVAAVWPATVVEDSNLTVQISALRRVLDRGRSNGSCIQTVSGRGYRFVGTVTRCGTDPRPAVGGNGEDRGAGAPPVSRLPTSAPARLQPWRAEGLAAQAVAVAPRSPLAHMAKGQVLRTQHRLDEAVREYETVLALDRNFVPAYYQIGLCKLSSGSVEETIPLVEQALRLSPRNPDIGFWYQPIGQAHLMATRTDEAVVWLERARAANPAQPSLHAWLVSAYALEGRRERAATELAEARRLSSDDRYSSIARLAAVGTRAPKARALFETTYFAGLRKAGMPRSDCARPEASLVLLW